MLEKSIGWDMLAMYVMRRYVSVCIWNRLQPSGAAASGQLPNPDGILQARDILRPTHLDGVRHSTHCPLIGPAAFCFGRHA